LEERFTFDREAALYAAARSPYPEALIDDVVAACGASPGARALEIGCGSGQATGAFAARGLDILAIDPGGDLLAHARRDLATAGAAADAVRFECTTFEAMPVTPERYALIYAAQSWHWVAPDVAYVKAAQALAREGLLAIFGHTPIGLDARLLAAFQRVYETHASWGPPPEAWYLPAGPVRALIDASGAFATVIHKAYGWTRRFTTASYVDLLRTRSDHHVMAPAQRGAILAGVAEAIAAHGGAFEMTYETNLYMAHKRA